MIDKNYLENCLELGNKLSEALAYSSKWEINRFIARIDDISMALGFLAQDMRQNEEEKCLNQAK